MVDAVENISTFKKRIMKIKLNKLTGLLTGLVLLINLNSCIKDKGFANETDFSQLQDHVLLVNGGVNNFSKSNVAFNSDTATITITVDLASVNLPSSPVVVTLGVDAALISTYNGANNTAFVLAPDSTYSLASTSVTIPAGQQYVTTTISFYKDKLDASLSYLVPISIMDASGKLLSSNQNTLYFNVIGNPIAGNYMEHWRRWAATDTTDPTKLQYDFTDPNVFAAASPTQVDCESVENGALFHISFTDPGTGLAGLTDFNIALDPSSWGNFGAVSISQDPKIIAIDPVNGYYSFIFKYSLSGGVARTVVQEFTRIP
jgi:BT_3987-like, N-terminal domain